MKRAKDSGFTLLELVIVVSILMLLAGVAVPVARKVRDRAAREATRAELDVLAEASAEHFRDTWRLPRSLEQLVRDPGLPGWTGPYVRATGTDPRTGAEAYRVDGWSNPYAVERRGADVLVLTSPGADGVMGEQDDPSVTVDVTGIRREETRARLQILNTAILRYNREWLGTDDLVPPYAAVLAKLVARGYLPAGGDLATDGFGAPFACDPPAAGPVVRVASPSLQ